MIVAFISAAAEITTIHGILMYILLPLLLLLLFLLTGASLGLHES